MIGYPPQPDSPPQPPPRWLIAATIGTATLCGFGVIAAIVAAVR